MLNQRRVVAADSHGGIVQSGQQILFDVAYFGRVLFETIEHELDVLPLLSAVTTRRWFSMICMAALVINTGAIFMPRKGGST